MECIKWKDKTTSGDIAHHYICNYQMAGQTCVWYCTRVLAKNPDGYGDIFRKVRNFRNHWLIERVQVFRKDTLDMMCQAANKIVLDHTNDDYDGRHLYF